MGLFGVPLPQQTVEKTGRFPCEDCPCGCSTAEFCWDKCCCHTDAEKLQWAADHGVDAPAFLVERAQASKPVVRLSRARQPTGKASSCCCCERSDVGESNSPPSTCAVQETDGGPAPSNSSTGASFNFGSYHPAGTHFLRVDGSVELVTESIDMELYRSRCTRAGHEIAPETP